MIIWIGCAVFFLGLILAVIAGIAAFVFLSRAPGGPRPSRGQRVLGISCLLFIVLLVGFFVMQLIP
jgi:hypothetical protein